MVETIKNYATSDLGASQSLVTLENFIGDVENTETVDDGTFDCSDAVTAINGLIFSLEQRDAKIERLRAALQHIAARRADMPLRTRNDYEAGEKFGIEWAGDNAEAALADEQLPVVAPPSD